MNDTVDDLHAAEDAAGSMAAAIRELFDARSAPRGPGATSRLRAAEQRLLALAEEWADYCRPCCGWRDSDPHECEEGGEDEGCGCPCGHGEEREPALTGQAFVDDLARRMAAETP